MFTIIDRRLNTMSLEFEYGNTRVLLPDLSIEELLDLKENLLDAIQEINTVISY